MMLRNVWLRHGASARRLLSTAAPSASVTEAMERFQGVPKFQQYPHFFPVTMSLQEYQSKFDSLEPKARCTEKSVALAGRIVAIRHASKNLVFLDLQSDGHTVQVLSEVKHFEGRGDEAAATGDNEAVKMEFRALHESLRRGDIIGVKGFPGKSGKGELSIIPRQLEVLAPCIQPFPNSKYGIKEPEIRFRKKYLDLLTNPGVRPIFETRAKVVRGIRRYLEDRNFMEVETPMLFSAAGGAAAQPFVTNSRALGKDLYLRIAPELFLKQLVIGGFDRVFEIGKVFRNEGIDATHNPEFTICEFYQAYADYNTLMDTAEEMISGIAKDVTGSYKVQYPMEEAAEEEGGDAAGDEPAMVEIDFTPPFKRLPILETLEECLGEKLPDVNSPDSIPALLELCERHNVDCAKPHTCTRLVDKLIGHFVEPKCVNPTFLYNHPTCMSPLAKAHREQQGVTERFELFVAGKELCNAYTELNDPFDQRRRFAAQQADQQRGDSEAHGKDDEFCTALEYGLPPTGGFGIGIDRLVMLLSGKPHIREVIMFPAMKPKDDAPAAEP